MSRMVYSDWDKMSISMRKVRMTNSKEYCKPYDAKRVNGKLRTKYVGCLGKNPGSKKKITGKEILPYAERLFDI